MPHRLGCLVLGLAMPLVAGCTGGPRPEPPPDVAGWRRAPVAGADLRIGPASPDGVELNFCKMGDERRLVAAERRALGAVPDDVKALAVRYRLTLGQGQCPRLGLVTFESDGGAWFTTRAIPLAETRREFRMPLRSLRRAAFSRDADDAPDWGQVERVWLGLVIDGPATGTLELADVSFTAEPLRPTETLEVPFADQGLWGVGRDPAATATVAVVPEGPEGKPCMRCDFAFPGARHMYVLPTLRVPDAELDGYRALRFAYKCTLPKGIDGLLVSLLERDGSQYCPASAPPASGEWRTVTIPLDTLSLGDWSKDENGRLDVADIGSMIIGLHGTAADAKASGTLWASDIEFIP